MSLSSSSSASGATFVSVVLSGLLLLFCCVVELDQDDDLWPTLSLEDKGPGYGANESSEGEAMLKDGTEGHTWHT